MGITSAKNVLVSTKIERSNGVEETHSCDCESILMNDAHSESIEQHQNETK